MAATAYGQGEVSKESRAIAAAADACEAAQEKHLARLSEDDQMQMGMEAMRTVQFALTMAKQSSYTADEKAYRLGHCDSKQMSAKQRKVCKLFAGSLIKEGKVNYMTLKGRRALDGVCELQHDISECR